MPSANAISSRRADMPVLLWLGMMGAMLACAISLIAPLTILWSRNAWFRINDEHVSRSEFILRGLSLNLLVSLVFGAIAFGLWKERRWTRPLIVIGFVAIVILSFGWPPSASEWVRHAFEFAALAFLVWYLYFKQDVVAYYQRLQERTADVEH